MKPFQAALTLNRFISVNFCNSEAGQSYRNRSHRADFGLNCYVKPHVITSGECPGSSCGPEGLAAQPRAGSAVVLGVLEEEEEEGGHPEPGASSSSA